MDPFTRHMLAGHTDMNTTKRYVHPNDTGIHEAMAKIWGRHTPGHTVPEDKTTLDAKSS